MQDQRKTKKQLIQELEAMRRRVVELESLVDKPNAEIVKYKQAQETLAKRAIELETVAQVSTATATILDISELLQTVVDLTKDSFNLSYVHINLLNENGDLLKLAASTGEVGQQLMRTNSSIRLDQKQSLIARAARTQQGVIVNDVSQDPGFLANPLLPDIRVEMAIPMIVGDTVIGVLSVQSAKINHFTDEDVRIQTILATQMAVAIESHRLFEEEQRQRQMAESLQEVAATLNSSLDQDTVLEKILNQLQQVIRYDSGALFLQDNNDLVIVGGARLADAYIGNRVPITGQDPTAQIFRTKQSRIIPDVHKDQYWTVWDENDHICSWMGVPLFVGERVIGVLTVDSFEVGTYGDKEIKVAQIFANQAAIAIQNARLYQEIRHEKRLFETMFQTNPIATITTNTNDLLTSWNPAAEALFGYTQAEAIGHSINNLITNDFTREDTYRYSNKLKNNQSTHAITQRRCKDGTLVDVELFAVPVILDGEAVGMFGLYHNLTDIKHTEAILREHEAQLSEALNIAQMAYWEFDIVTKTYTLNDHFYALIKTTVAQEGGYLMSVENFTEKFLHPNDIHIPTVITKKALASGKPTYQDQQEFRLIQTNGEEIHIMARLKIAQNEQGQITKLYGTVQDITERKRAEQVQAALYRIANTASTVENIQEFHMAMHRTVDELMHTPNFYIALYDEAKQRIRFPFYVDEKDDESVKPNPNIWHKIEQLKGLTTYVLRTGQPLLASRKNIEILIQQGEIELLGSIPVDWLGVPLKVNERLLGVLAIQSHTKNIRYSAKDKELLIFVAQHIATALERVRLLEETRQRVTELATINSVSTAISSKLDHDVLIELVGEQIRYTFEANIVYIALYDRPTNIIHFPFEYGDKTPPRSFSQGLTERIIETNQPLLINANPDTHYAQLNIKQFGIRPRSYLGVPISIGNQAIGVISVQSITQTEYFNESDLRLLTTIAANVGTAIQNAQLYQETQHRASETAALAEIGREISATLDLPTVLERIATHAHNLLKANNSAVFLPDTDEQTFRAIVAMGDIAPQIKAASVQLGRGIIGNLAQRKVAEVINDVQGDPRAIPIPDTTTIPDAKLMVAPLLSRDKVVGMMAVWRKGLRAPFTQADLSFLVDLSRQAVIAVENARLFKEAQTAKDVAEAANQAKSIFLANMSHELRTPLNAVLGFTQLVQRDSTLTSEQHKNLNIIARSGEHLLTLINNVLEMSKIEAGHTTLNANPFNLYRLLNNLEDMFHLRAKEKGLNLKFKHMPQVPQFVCTDEGKLRQVLMNLVSNALKFTNKGEVVLRVSRGTDEQKTATSKNSTSPSNPLMLQLYFEISDTGVGIPAHEINKLFAPFTQTESGRNLQTGTGLGLAISQQFVGLMGGKITVKSQVNQGSVFKFNIQVEPTEATVYKFEKPNRRIIGLMPQQPNYRLLVAEDTLESRKLLTELLKNVGFEVREAVNGEETITIWKQWNPHLIWMDIRMPILNGYEVTKHIKAKPEGQNTIIIALTAGALKENQSRALAAGCTDFMSKPFQETEIFTKIADHLGVKYVYEDNDDLDNTDDSLEKQLTTAMTALPANLISNLQTATLRGKFNQILALIEQIHKQDTFLANQLNDLANNFEYDKILALIQYVGEQK